jgi:hypothetical protein
MTLRFPSTGRDSITATRAGALRRRRAFSPTANAGQGSNLEMSGKRADVDGVPKGGMSS